MSLVSKRRLEAITQSFATLHGVVGAVGEVISKQILPGHGCLYLISFQGDERGYIADGDYKFGVLFCEVEEGH